MANWNFFDSFAKGYQLKENQKQNQLQDKYRQDMLDLERLRTQREQERFNADLEFRKNQSNLNYKIERDKIDNSLKMHSDNIGLGYDRLNQQGRQYFGLLGQRALDRTSNENIARWNINSREKIAGMNEPTYNEPDVSGLFGDAERYIAEADKMQKEGLWDKTDEGGILYKGGKDGGWKPNAESLRTELVNKVGFSDDHLNHIRLLSGIYNGRVEDRNGKKIFIPEGIKEGYEDATKKRNALHGAITKYAKNQNLTPDQKKALKYWVELGTR